MASRIWLGIPSFTANPPLKCPCGSLIDPNGDHLLGCGQGPLRIRRHDALRDILYQALVQDNPSVRREQRISGDSHDRPGDIYHPDFANGRPTYFDISIANSLQPSKISHTATTAGIVGTQAECMKDRKHADNVERVGGVFTPLVVESLGLWTPTARKTLSEIAARTTIHNGLTPLPATIY